MANNNLILARNNIHNRKLFSLYYNRYKKDECVSYKNIREYMRYILVCRFVNHVLLKIGRKPVNKLTDVKNLDKKDLDKLDCSEDIDIFIPLLLEYFSMREVYFYKKNNSKNYVIILLRNLLKAIGYNFVSKPYNITVEKGLLTRGSIYRIYKK